MDAALPPRLACVSLHDLDLQLAERRLTADAPIAMVDRTGSQGRVTKVSKLARAAGIRPGLRASAAIGLAPALVLAEVDPAEIEAAAEALLDELSRFSPRIEADAAAPGSCWIDPAGMGRLFGEPAAWADALTRHLEGLGWRAGVVLGFSRFCTRALAGVTLGLRILESPKIEAGAAARLPLAGLGLPERRLNALAALEIRTLGDLLRLPAAELRGRFGPEVAELHAEASGRRWRPLTPRDRREPLVAESVLEPPEESVERLLFAIKALLPDLLARLASGERVAALELRLALDHAEPIELRVEPAEASAELLLLLDLIRLRLAATPLAAAVTDVTITVTPTRPSAPQLGLLGAPRRDPRAAERALARVRAAYGDEAVTRASLRPAHLPEAGFTWEPTAQVAQPRAREVAANLSEGSPCMIRRLLARPLALNAAAAEGDDDRPPPPSLAGPGLPVSGAIRELHGPHRVSGGWWARAVERDYYYAETSGGELLWLFYDRPRRRWFLHGVVE